jgi:antitoxin component YwqK of YwqJK toxin-antitoxin module
VKHYRSSIPKAARERVTATFTTSPQKYQAECILNGKVVGIRRFHEAGELEFELPLKNGVRHGIQYRSEIPGKLLSAEPYSNGFPHGTARQWSDDGTLLGSYTMKHGTGFDLWWADECGFPYLSEVRYFKDGKRHGFQWCLNADQKSVWWESHFHNNQMHGIERSWNHLGRLHRGYPRYWVNNLRMTNRQYLRACDKDPTLPPFRETGNRPQRKFPPAIAAIVARPMACADTLRT